MGALPVLERLGIRRQVLNDNQTVLQPLPCCSSKEVTKQLYLGKPSRQTGLLGEPSSAPTPGAGIRLRSDSALLAFHAVDIGEGLIFRQTFARLKSLRFYQSMKSNYSRKGSIMTTKTGDISLYD